MKRFSRWSMIVALVYCVLVTADEARADDGKTELDGTWVVSSAKRAGEEFEQPVGDMVVFAGKSMTIKPKNSPRQVKATIAIDGDKSPKHLDIEHDGKTGTAVFGLEGKTLKMCLAPPGEARPKGLESEKGSKQISLVLQLEEGS